MHAIRIAEHGGPEVLVHTEVPDPEAGPGAVLVDVAAAGVNYYDTYQRDGRYRMPLPYVPGLEGRAGCGAVGAGVSGIAVGDRVAWSTAQGSYAERIAVAADQLVTVPAGVPDDVAAGCLLQGMTAWLLVHKTLPFGPGDPVLVHAAAGGVGLLLTQLVTANGGRVIATVSTDEKEQLARAAGAEHVLRYGSGLVESVRDLTGGAGVAVAYDGVGAATVEMSLAALRSRGGLVLYGASSGAVESVAMSTLHAGSLFLCRPSIFAYTADRAELVPLAAAVFDAVAAGTLDVRIGQRYPLEKAAVAHEDLHARRTTGKIVLVP